MLRFLLTSVLAAVVLSGQPSGPSLSTPKLGAVRMPDGSVRAVFGAPGSFVLGEPILRRSVAASFSDSGGLVAFADRLVLLDSQMAVIGQQPISHSAMVGITAGPETAVAWIADASTLLFWDGESFSSVEVQNLPSGKVWSLTRSGERAVLQFEDGQATVSLETGNLIDYRVVPDGPKASIAQAVGQNKADINVERMSDRYIHVSSRTDHRTWVLRGNDTQGRVWELPAAKEQQ